MCGVAGGGATVHGACDGSRRHVAIGPWQRGCPAALPRARPSPGGSHYPGCCGGHHRSQLWPWKRLGLDIHNILHGRAGILAGK